ncbi:uncharacterized protein [Montipora capricornis]|uniref:uncharacterized protein isoform X1 n=2 Tax=Montipora capricornis TaxID=246305 RepID=UPI0035F140C2
MGNPESLPDKKILGQIKTEGEVFLADKGKVPCDRDVTRNSLNVENGSETIGKRGLTVTINHSTSDSDGELKRETESSASAVKNGSPWGTAEEHKHLWEEVAMRYQEILHREYKMLNLPSYTVSGGNLYLYYVPVIINPGIGEAHSSADNEYTLADRQRSSGSNSKEIIYVSDDDGVSKIKKEQVKIEQKLENCCSFQNHSKKESPKVQDVFSERVNSDCADISYASYMYEDRVHFKTEKDFGKTNHCIEFEQNIKDIEQERHSNCYDDERLEKREGHLRIFKGYTIEYHPLRSADKLSLETEKDKKRVEKIEDLKKRLAEQEKELEKLRARPVLEQNVSTKDRVNGILEKKKATENHTFWKRIRDYPSVQIHYFPSGERRESPQRTHLRKQTSPRQIRTLSSAKLIDDNDFRSFAKSAKMEETVNGNHPVSKGKRKLNHSPEIHQERPIKKRIGPVHRQRRSTKCGKRSKRLKRRRNHRKEKSILRISSQDPQTASETRFMEKVNKSLFISGNTCKANVPQDLNQDEFLATFGLARVLAGQLNDSI